MLCSLWVNTSTLPSTASGFVESIESSAVPTKPLDPAASGPSSAS